MSDNYITTQDSSGSLNISEDVIAIVVGAAVSDVEGVAGLTSSVNKEISDFLGRKGLSRGVKVQFGEEGMTVDTVILIRFGYPVTTVAEQVQTAVGNAVESMAGMGTPRVNVHVAGITFDKA